MNKFFIRICSGSFYIGLAICSGIFFICGCFSDEENETEIVSSNRRRMSNEESTINWEGKNQLKWSDFRKSPGGPDTFDAGTSSGFEIQYYPGDKGEYVIVYANFNKDSSYVKSEQKSAELLNHENMHFNLTEVAAREVRRGVNAWSGVGVLKDYVEIYYDSIHQDHLNRQSLYDLETDHGRNAIAQKVWNNKIDSMLKELEPYSVPGVRLKVKNQKE